MTRKKKPSEKKYSNKAQEIVREKLHEMKEGALESGRSHKKVTSRSQAIAIGISEARKKGTKVPALKKNSSNNKTKSAKKTTSQTKSKTKTKTATKAKKKTTKKKR